MQAIRNAAEKYEIPEFAIPTFKIDQLNHLGSLPGASIASVATQLSCHTAFFGGEKDGAKIYFGVQVPLPEPTIDSLNVCAQQTTPHTSDIANALRLWTFRRNCEVSELDGGIKITLPNGTYVEFYLE